MQVLYRPLTMEQGGVVLMDLLWSDPTTNDGVQVRIYVVFVGAVLYELWHITQPADAILVA